MKKIGIVVFSGANSSRDVKHVLEEILCQQVEEIDPSVKELSGFDGIVIPGGFSYADIPRPGAIACSFPVGAAISRFAEDGGPVLGLGNGFQILCEIGLLPGILLQNHSMKFASGQVNVCVKSVDSHFSKFFAKDQVFKLPISCYYGQYFVESRLATELRNEGRIPFLYANKYDDPEVDPTFLGSLWNIAGVTNKEKNVLGMMPRPELVAHKNEQALSIFSSFVGVGITVQNTQ